MGLRKQITFEKTVDFDSLFERMDNVRRQLEKVMKSNNINTEFASPMAKNTENTWPKRAIDIPTLAEDMKRARLVIGGSPKKSTWRTSGNCPESEPQGDKRVYQQLLESHSKKAQVHKALMIFTAEPNIRSACNQ